MTSEQESRLQYLIEELGELLWEEADGTQLHDLEGLESELRRLGQLHLFPRLASFFVARMAGAPVGHLRRLNTVLGVMELGSQQARHLGVTSHRQVSPLLEKCLLVAAAKTSFAQAECDLHLLCGVEVSDSTIRRLALKTSTSCEPAPAPELAPELVSLVCVDGGMVRLKAESSETGTHWRQYQAISLDAGQEMLARFGAQQSFATQLPHSCHTLDWYHLKQNIWKQPWGRGRKEKIEQLLWNGELEAALAQIEGYQRQKGTLSGYLLQHQTRIPHADTSSAKRQEQQLPLGSGSVESAIKQIDARMQLTGAWWKPENVNPMLDLRCAYLNGGFYH